MLENCKEGTEKLLIGNKVDLVDVRRERFRSKLFLIIEIINLYSKPLF